MRERDIEKHLVQRVKELGGEIRKVKWLGRRGAPDRVVMLPDGGVRGLSQEIYFARTIWVELKAPGVAAEDYQIREHNRMRRMGQRVEVIDSIEGVERLLVAARGNE